MQPSCYPWRRAAERVAVRFNMISLLVPASDGCRAVLLFIFEWPVGAGWGELGGCVPLLTGKVIRSAPREWLTGYFLPVAINRTSACKAFSFPCFTFRSLRSDGQGTSCGDSGTLEGSLKNVWRLFGILPFLPELRAQAGCSASDRPVFDPAYRRGGSPLRAESSRRSKPA